MSLISEQVEELRHESKMFHKTAKLYKLLSNAADIIEELSAKLASANMERSKQYYKNSDDYIGKQALIKAICDSGLFYTISQHEADTLEQAIESVPLVGAFPVIRCKDCRQWGTGFPAETEYGKVCRYAGYMVGANGYCVYGEKK